MNSETHAVAGSTSTLPREEWERRFLTHLTMRFTDMNGFLDPSMAWNEELARKEAKRVLDAEGGFEYHSMGFETDPEGAADEALLYDEAATLARSIFAGVPLMPAGDEM